MARGLKFRIKEGEILYQSNENEGADQLRSYRTADLLLCFPIYSQNWLGDRLSSATSCLVRPHLGPPVHFSMHINHLKQLPALRDQRPLKRSPKCKIYLRKATDLLTISNSRNILNFGKKCFSVYPENYF